MASSLGNPGKTEKRGKGETDAEKEAALWTATALSMSEPGSTWQETEHKNKEGSISIIVNIISINGAKCPTPAAPLMRELQIANAICINMDGRHEILLALSGCTSPSCTRYLWLNSRLGPHRIAAPQGKVLNALVRSSVWTSFTSLGDFAQMYLWRRHRLTLASLWKQIRFGSLEMESYERGINVQAHRQRLHVQVAPNLRFIAI
ncbi:hypothetical protein BBK36DRAFT_1204025 [Trichoderma citrinoviride]|uniref:Uncharacterized protein n=1 Tax=Trichoderma citrinoviride TaxID=58853 RepID=A0A2T4B763_9HYPO|nr:hypothetical protein BBK36DRAFT_1204025 [Trichoderma citrinoviride]PTB65051.1 hypothetical protein BBK36DRAFT_1204025 [Trichoderma citrinoviride]